MASTTPHILTINGGSSSIKFALFDGGDVSQRILGGAIERIGQPQGTLKIGGATWQAECRKRQARQIMPRPSMCCWTGSSSIWVAIA